MQKEMQFPTSLLSPFFYIICTFFRAHFIIMCNGEHLSQASSIAGKNL